MKKLKEIIEKIRTTRTPWCYNTHGFLKYKKTKTTCLIISLFFIITIISVVIIGIAINNEQGKIDISKFIPKWTEKAPEASETVIEENVRDIDLTRIITGEDARHTHIYEKRYDSNYHWEQCWMCNEVINKVAHNFTVRGVYGCGVEAGYQTKYCDDGCGYSEQLPKKEHTIVTEWQQWVGGSVHYKHCTECGHWVGGSEYCTDSNGQKIGCNAGTCVICGAVYNGSTHGRIENETCYRCGVKLLDFTTSKEIVSENSTRIYYTIIPIDGLEMNIDNVLAYSDSMGYLSVGTWTFEIEEKYKSGNEYHVTALYTANSTASSESIVADIRFNSYTINGINQADALHINYPGYISPDNYAPTKNSVSGAGSGSIGNFGTKATVTATFTDGWHPTNNVVYMRLVDKDKNTVISDWGAASQNGTTFTRTFDVTAEIREPANVYVQAKDATRKHNRIREWSSNTTIHRRISTKTSRRKRK